MTVHNAPTTTRASFEVADIFKEHGDRCNDKKSLPFEHVKVINAIVNCRTAILGGHHTQCDNCGVEDISYNSCRNRHCPKCQTARRLQWIAQREAELLPVPYFHVVFTLPHELNPLLLSNKKLLYDLLFKAASKTLITFGQDPKRLGGKLGAIMVLHTWGQTLSLHPHVHCIVPGGALTSSGSWISAKSNYLFPVRAMAKHFRANYLFLLQEYRDKEQLQFHGSSQALLEKNGLNNLINKLWKKNWIVYAKKPFGGPEQVIQYLGNYTHRIAISNHRITKIENGFVWFRYKDYADSNKTKIMKLSVHDFCQRFVLHILPSQFTRIRQIGLLANRTKKQALEKCHHALGSIATTTPKETTQAIILRVCGTDIEKCSNCEKGNITIIRLFSNQLNRARLNDTS